MTKLLRFLFALIFLSACGPYRGFKGVNPKGMKNSTTPSQEIRDDYKKQEKKSSRAYKREMKRREKKYRTY